MSTKKTYTSDELQALHVVLMEILAEIQRVCEQLSIPFFIQGGTAMGAYFENDIMAWDDDIDVGMTRDNYERFLKEAPAILDKRYFLAWFGTDPNTPFYFAKVRKNHTLFLESTCKDIAMHHGIYVDIFPFDKVPDNENLQARHRKLCNILNSWFMSKSFWPWRYFGHCSLAVPLPKGIIDCLITRIAVTLLPKQFIYQWLRRMQSRYNSSLSHNYNIVMTSVDHIPVADIAACRSIRFGNINVPAPDHLEDYLHHHYGPHIQRIPPKEKQINHAPLELSFQTEAPQGR